MTTIDRTDLRHRRTFAVCVAAVVLTCVTVAGCTPSSSGATTPPSRDPSSVSSRTATSSSSSSTAPATTSAPASATPRVAQAAATVGTLHSAPIPGRLSHFAARPAEIYLPPILRTQPNTRLPVLELLHGTPGYPNSWVTAGGVVATMNRFAATHGGRAPIVVMPDINGTYRGDTECIRTPSGANVETYLLKDVPYWIATHYRTLPSPTGWAVAGLSEGGTCAIMLALRSTVFHVFADLSGLSRPTVGPHDDPPATIAQLFGGSRKAYDEHDPLYLMARHRYPSLAGWFFCGAQDPEPLRSQRQLAAAARRAGATVVERVVPGTHSWKLWEPALRNLLPWLWSETT